MFYRIRTRANPRDARCVRTSMSLSHEHQALGSSGETSRGKRWGLADGGWGNEGLVVPGATNQDHTISAREKSATLSPHRSPRPPAPGRNQPPSVEASFSGKVDVDFVKVRQTLGPYLPA